MLLLEDIDKKNMNPLEIDRTSKIVSAIVGHFKDQGYKADYEIVDGSKVETDEGIDAVVIVGAKMLGIQTKRIYTNSSAHYKLKERQHNLIKEREWVYYAFPENMPRTVEKDVLLHRTLFSSGKFSFKKTMKFEEITGGVRWGKIAEGIDKCSIGLRFENEKEKAGLNVDLRKIFREFVVFFAIDVEKKHLRVSGYEQQIDRRAFRKKGIKIGKKKEINTDKPSVCPTCGKPLDNID